MVQTAATIWRDYETDGVPSSGAHDPVKADIRAAVTALETNIAAGLSNGGLIYDTKASLDADLVHAANASAWVISDSTVANNGIYRKSGASGAGSWAKVADLPYSFIKAADAGAGTASAIVATTSIPIPSADGGALIALNIYEDNTATPVTVAFNGATALTIKTNTGADIAIGGLTAGMIVAGYVSGLTFRLLSDQASAAVLAACEAAQAAAESAQAAAEAAAAAAEPTALESASYASSSFHPTVAPNFIIVAGYTAAGDGGKALYKKAASEPTHPGKFSITLDDGVTVVWYEIAETVLDPRMFGAIADDSTDCASAFGDAYDTAIAIGAAIEIPYLLAGEAFLLSSTWTLGDGVRIFGHGVSPYTNQVDTGSGYNRGYTYRGPGSWLHFDHTATGILYTGTDALALGTIIENCGFIRTQPMPAASWAPTDADFDIAVIPTAGSMADIKLRNLHLLCASNGVYASAGTGRLVIENISGQAFKKFISLDGCTDVCRVEGIHQWPYWSGHDDVIAYQLINLKVFDLGKVDNPKLDKLFSIYHHTGVLLRNGTTVLAGQPAKVSVGAMDMDVGVWAVQIDCDNGTGAFWGTLTSQGESGTGVGGPIVYVTGDNNLFTFPGGVANKISYTNGIRIEAGAAGNRLVFGDVFLEQYDETHSGAAPVNPGIWTGDSGNTIEINGSTLFTTLASSDLVVGGSGSLKIRLGGGSVSTTTDGSGQVVVTHGLKTAPSRVQVVLTSDTYLTYAVTAKTATTFTVKFRVADGSGTTYASGAVAFDWEATLG